MLKQSRAEKRTAREPKLTTESSEAFMPDEQSVAESTSTWGVVNVEVTTAANPMDELRMPSSKLPWQICKYLKPQCIQQALIGCQLSRVVDSLSAALFSIQSSSTLCDGPMTVKRV